MTSKLIFVSLLFIATVLRTQGAPAMPESMEFLLPPLPDKLMCSWDEVMLLSGSCDGTCEDPMPSCLHTRVLEPRCGCAPGKVKNSEGYCSKFVRCPNKPPGSLSQCMLEHAFTFEECGGDGLFQRTRVVDGRVQCVHDRTGDEIPGKSVPLGESINCDELTSCQAVFVADLNDQLKYPDRMDGSNIQCDQMGNYERRQCVSYTDYCDCVVPETGNRIPGLANVGESADCLLVTYTACQAAFIDVDIANARQSLIRIPYPMCDNEEGMYEQKVCDDFGICSCYDRFTGVELPGRGANMNCRELTACQEEFLRMGEKAARNCDDDGRYFYEQCDTDGSCACVDVDTGVELEGTRKAAFEGTPKAMFFMLKDMSCPEPLCPSNMEWNTCAGCDETCENKDILMMCTMNCRMKCTCPPMTVWNADVDACTPEVMCSGTIGPPSPFRGMPGLPPDFEMLPPLPPMPPM